MLDKVKKYIELNSMLSPEDSVIVGVSGGADSMCLLSVLLELGVKVYVVHVNHMLRGQAADDDMAYVENFCKNRDVECYSFSYDVEKIAKEKKLSSEEAGRMVRYEAFYEVMKETNSSKIAVAHNAGDNAETILHNLFRGTGIKGLTGILATRDEIIRPLLCVTRAEIEEYLKDKGIEYRVDNTNLEDTYTRNKIRNTVLPYVNENINKNATEHVNMAGQRLHEINDFISIEGDKLYEKLVTMDCCMAKISVTDFLPLHNVMKSYIVRKSVHSVKNSLKDIAYQHIESILALFQNEVGKEVNLPYGIIAKKDYETVNIFHNTEASNDKTDNDVSIKIGKFGEFFMNESGEKLVISPFSSDEWEALDNKYEEKIYTKWLDCDILNANLEIRKRKTGDYIIVDSKGSRKKLKDLFIDMKIPKEQRDKIWLMADGNEIVWIIGHRINYNYRVTKDTKDIIKVEYKN